MIRKRSSFGSPRRKSLMIGSRKPSSKISRESAESSRPPTSGEWETQAA
jgi:hypothetical protein